MRQAQKGDTVKVHFKGTLDNGKEFASTSEAAPIEFTIGEGTLIRGFEEETVGMAPGETKTVRLEAERAFGHKRYDLISKIPRNAVPENIQLSVSLNLQMNTPSGNPVQVVVTEISEKELTIDANPPLVGEPLNFDIELVEFV
jgi:FKBP-type peptidyl-prolyl cis-trans isomerase 2